MTRKQMILVAVAVLLAAIYAYFFTDWFVKPRIQIISQVRPFRAVLGNTVTYPITFTFDRSYKLTSVKVVPLDSFLTNKHTPAVWSLVSSSNSAPVQGFTYGKAIAGMRPAVTNAKPEKLKPNIGYRLLVEAGKARGEVDFKTR